jgi:hypothetical protein
VTVGAITVGSVAVDFHARNEKLKRVARESVQAVRTAAMDMRQSANVVGDQARQWDRASSAVHKFGKSITERHAEFPKLVEDFDQLTGKLGALVVMAPSIIGLFQGAAGGALGLAGGLTPLAGLAGAGAVGITALAQAGGTLALALKDVNKTSNPLHAALDRTKRDIGGLQEIAQQATLPMFAKAVDRLRTLLPLAGGAIRATGLELGHLADEGSRMLASGPWKRDFSTVAGANVRIIESLGNAGLHAANTIRSLVTEAAPLAVALSEMAARGARTVDVFIQNARASGQLRDFYRQTLDVTQTLVHSASNLAVAFGRVLKAGQPLGTDMLHSFEKLTAQVRQWTGTARGQAAINQFFEQARPILEQVGSLIQLAAKHASAFIQRALQISNVLSSILDNVPGLKTFVAYFLTLGTLLKITSVGALAKGFVDLAKGIRSGVQWLLAMEGAATGAAVAEERLAVANAAASASWAGYAGLAAAAVAVNAGAVVGLDKLTRKTGELPQLWMHVLGPLGDLTVLFGLWNRHQEQAAIKAEALKSAQQDLAGSMAVNVVQLGAMAVGGNQAGSSIRGLSDKELQLSARTAELKTKLADLKAQLSQNRDAIKEQILNYQGLVGQSKVTTKQVLDDIHNQVLNFRTYSRDVQTLIKAGVNPSAIQELSKKGPEYVHALAAGSNKQLLQYKRDWAARQAEIRDHFNHSLEGQLADLQKKIRDMQRQINSLHGKSIEIDARPALQFSQSVSAKDWLFYRRVAGRMAEGGRITAGSHGKADDVPVWLSKGEYVVNAQSTRKYLPYLEWINAQKLAGGGLTKQTFNAWDQVHSGQNWVLSTGVGNIFNRAVNVIMRGAVAGGPAIASTANQRLVQHLAGLLYGWVGAQWNALYHLLMGESGFRNTAQNPVSSAYGMFQFLNSTWGSVGAVKTSDPYLQTIAGLRYIAQRYGSPVSAYGAWLSRSPHWYGDGGIAWSPQLAVVGDKGPEAILPLRHTGTMLVIEQHFDIDTMVGGNLDQLVKDLTPPMRAALRTALRREGRPELAAGL